MSAHGSFHFSLLDFSFFFFCSPLTKSYAFNTHTRTWYIVRQKITFELNKNNPRRKIFDIFFSASQASHSQNIFPSVVVSVRHYTHFHRPFMAVFQSNFGWKLLTQFCFLSFHVLALNGLLFRGFMLHLSSKSTVGMRVREEKNCYRILFFHSLHFCYISAVLVRKIFRSPSLQKNK